jgi:hypothetical protein
VPGSALEPLVSPSRFSRQIENGAKQRSMPPTIAYKYRFAKSSHALDFKWTLNFTMMTTKQ